MLFEVLWLLFVFVICVLGAQLAVSKVWNRRLHNLQKERRAIDGALFRESRN